MSMFQVVNLCFLGAACIFAFYCHRIKKKSDKNKGDIRKHEVFTSPTAPSDQKEDE